MAGIKRKHIYEALAPLFGPGTRIKKGKDDEGRKVIEVRGEDANLLLVRTGKTWKAYASPEDTESIVEPDEDLIEVIADAAGLYVSMLVEDCLRDLSGIERTETDDEESGLLGMRPATRAVN